MNIGMMLGVVNFSRFTMILWGFFIGFMPHISRNYTLLDSKRQVFDGVGVA